MSKRRFKSFNRVYSFYVRYSNYRILVLVLLSLVTGLLESVGISSVFPLLENIFSSENSSGHKNPIEFIGKIFTNFSLPQSETSLFVFFISIFLLKAIFKYATGVYKTFIATDLLKKSRLDFLTNLYKLNFQFYTSLDTGRVANTITLELENSMRGFIYFTNYIVNIFTATAFLIFVFFVDFRFSILIIFSGFLYYSLFINVNRSIKNLSKQITTDNSSFNSLLIQIVQAFKYLKATNAFQKLSPKIDKEIDSIRFKKNQMDIRTAFVGAVQEPIVILIVTLVVYFSLIYFKTEPEQVFLALILFYRSTNYFLSSQTIWNNFISQVGSTESVMEVDELYRANAELETYKTSFEKIKNGIEFKNVCFDYNEGNKTLRNVSLNFPAKKTIALVGKSGSGKSTILNLITGILQPQKGSVLIDGCNLNEIDMAAFRKSIGFISQEPIIFNDTLKNNITLWDTHVDDKALLDAVNKSYSFQMMEDFGGWDTILGDRGAFLSGGQRQRIFIAREFFKRPSILIMDEATSALDSETERMIQESINDLHGEMIIIIVAHRLSTIKKADTIYVIDNGEVIEEGNYEELMVTESRFKEMVKLQSFG